MEKHAILVLSLIMLMLGPVSPTHQVPTYSIEETGELLPNPSFTSAPEVIIQGSSDEFGYNYSSLANSLTMT